jgi:hypothetical protein
LRLAQADGEAAELVRLLTFARAWLRGELEEKDKKSGDNSPRIAYKWSRSL